MTFPRLMCQEVSFQFLTHNRSPFSNCQNVDYITEEEKILAIKLPNAVSENEIPPDSGQPSEEVREQMRLYVDAVANKWPNHRVGLIED